MVLPTYAVIDDAHRLRQYWEAKFFGDPFGLKTVDEALSETWPFFDESRYAPAREFLDMVIRKSMSELKLKPDTLATPDLFYRVNENFILFEVSVQKKKLCDFNDADVQGSCGTMYLKGERLKRNLELAISWFEKAASQNNIYALYTLAKLYIWDTETSTNYSRAIQLLEKATSLGDDDSPAFLAGLYAEGKGVEVDNSRAAHWARIGAERAVPNAQGLLAMFYAKGTGVNRNLVEAAAWMETAANGGDKTAQLNLPIIQRTMSESDKRAAKLRAVELRKFCKSN